MCFDGFFCAAHTARAEFTFLSSVAKAHNVPVSSACDPGIYFTAGVVKYLADQIVIKTRKRKRAVAEEEEGKKPPLKKISKLNSFGLLSAITFAFKKANGSLRTILDSFCGFVVNVDVKPHHFVLVRRITGEVVALHDWQLDQTQAAVLYKQWQSLPANHFDKKTYMLDPLWSGMNVATAQRQANQLVVASSEY